MVLVNNNLADIQFRFLPPSKPGLTKGVCEPWTRRLKNYIHWLLTACLN
jgi:hypothetical protein